MRVFAIFLFLCCAGISYAQTTTDSVFVAKSFLGFKFYQNDVRLNFNQLPFVMEENPEAFNVIKKAKSNYTLSTILGGAGGFLLGWQLGTAAFGGNPNWALAGVGGALIVVSIPISRKSYNLAFDAIDIHNGAVSGSARRMELKLGATSSGVGIVLKF